MDNAGVPALRSGGRLIYGLGDARRRPIRARALCLLAIPATVGASIASGWCVSRIGDVGLANAALPVLVAVFGLTGGLVIWLYARREEAASLLPLITAFYLLAFAVGAVYYRYPGHAVGGSALVGFRDAYTNRGLVLALAMVLAAYAAFAAAFMGANFMRLCASLPTPHSENGEDLTRVVVALLVLGWAARIMMVHRGLYFRYSGSGDAPASRGQFATLLSTVSYLPLMAFAVTAISRTRSGNYRIAFWAQLATELAWALPSGERARIVGLGLLLVVNRYYSSKSGFPWRAFATWAAVAVFVILPFGTFYRGPGGASDYQNHPITQLGVAAREMVARSSSLPQIAFDETFSRFSDIASVAALTTQGRGKYPLGSRATLATWVDSAVPRFILPGKADPGKSGNNFGRAYGIVYRTSQASISTTYVGDLYGAFGFSWMLVGMAAVGVLMRGLDEYLGNRRDNPIVFAIYLTALGPLLLRLETTIAVGFIQIVKDVFVYAVVGGLVVTLARGRGFGQRSATPTSMRPADRRV